MKPLGYTQEQWDAIWASTDGQRFRDALTLMWRAFPPNKDPHEHDFQTFFWGLRNLMPRFGVDIVIAGIERAAAVSDKYRPSTGMISAHAERVAEQTWEHERKKRALPEKPFVPMTPEQHAEIKELIRRMPRGPVPQALGRAVGR